LAPTNLVYPQATITVATGQAIPADTPTVTGTVTAYSISPALPAGLSLNTTTGVISGTPTAVATQATYTITATNSSGTTTSTVQITVNAAILPPANLIYSQTTITATVGQAIATDTPTVTGTVTSYSVSPTLPAGLAISTTTGAISGTPTAATAQATYTITATNSAGSTTATVQILVNAAVPAPSNLVYPQANIIASVGQAIPGAIPSVTGTVTSFSVSPTLPAGLSLSATTGAITGTPTAASPQTNYTVTAANGGGSTATTVSILVNPALTTLLDTGHSNQIGDIHVSATRVLSHDYTHWVLWDYASNSRIASGDQVLPAQTRSLLNPPSTWPVDMANQIFVIGQTNGLDVRDTSDGHIIAEIQSQLIDSPGVISWWKLATDGTYICTGSTQGLSAWSSTGQALFTRPGDYSKANVYPAPGQILVANGPAGANVIETVKATDGTATAGPAFSGTFNSWFVDGQRFLTNTGSAVWTYSAASVQQSLVSLPSVEHLAGEGNWYWTYSGSTSGQINIYAVGANTPSLSFTPGILATVVPSGNTVGVLPYGTASASVVDLSGATPVKTDYALTVAYESVYGAVSPSQWLVGNGRGVLLDGASTTTAPRYFGTGQVWSMAGSSTLVAIATANGKISYYSPSSSSLTPVGTINFPSSKIALSSDGTVLVAMANALDAQYETDRTLNIYSLPAGNLIYSIPYTFTTGGQNLFDFSLSGSGTVTGQVLGTSLNNGTWSFTRQAAPTSGGPVIWSDTPAAQAVYVAQAYYGINLSPDGTLIAVSSGPTSPTFTTSIYKNGILATAVNGLAIGWIDNNQLLVNNYGQQLGPSTYAYAGASIYSATGSLISNPSLPELLTIQPVDSTSIYSPTRNTIFSLPSGNVLYQSGTPVTGPAAVAGPSVVFSSGTRIVVDTH
jgi:hypothetical protein